MYPDDRVLVGIINRKKDLNILRDQRWYRIPQERMPRGVYTEYLAFYISGYPAQALGGPGVYYYAARRGVELAYRRDLLPKEAEHKNANAVYYQVQLGEITPRTPPITNPTKRPLSFVYTTWDRFLQARIIADLYSTSDYFVDRIYHALRDARYRPQRYWAADTERGSGFGQRVRILCEKGPVVAAMHPGDDVTVLMETSQTEDDILRAIKAQIAAQGGVVTLPTPYQ